MKTCQIKRLLLVTAAAIAVLAGFPAAQATGTPAGTNITNQATVDYLDANSNPLQALSNTVTTTVSQVGGVNITPNRSGSANPSDKKYYAHTVTNSGNGTDKVNLRGVSSQGWTLALWQDVNNNGVYDSGTDTLLTDTNSDGTVDTGDLAHDATMNILAEVDVPAGAANGAVDTTTVTARSVFDVTKTSAVTDTTTVNAPQIGVVKSVLPTGNQPPNTVLTYTIVVTNNGGANALSTVLTDPIPSNTTYEAGTITQDSSGKTDIADGDNADYNATNPGKVTVTIGTLAPAASTTITFQVRIN